MNRERQAIGINSYEKDIGLNPLAFLQEEMVFKLGREELKPYLEQYIGAKNWDPSGKKRPMKDWIQIPTDYKQDWPRLAQEALEYLENES